MNNNYNKQTQFELFPGSSSNPNEPIKARRFTIKALTLSVENIIVVSIVLLMVVVVFFSFGVERGKHIADVSEGPEKINLANETKGAIIAAPLEAQDMDEAKIQVLSDQNRPKVLEPHEEILELPVGIEREPDNYYTIQVASFKLEKSAQREAMGLKQRGYDTLVVPKGSYSIVCVGKFTQRHDAKAFSTQLRSKYKDCLVRRL